MLRIFIVFDRAESDSCLTSHEASRQPMSTEAAMDQEWNSNSHAHTSNLDTSGWDPQPVDTWALPQDDPPLTAEELRTRLKQVKVDQVRDMVPFWIKAVEAARKGEVMKMEDFLDKLATQDRWGICEIGDPWGCSIGPWPADHPHGALVPGGPQDPWVKTTDDGWGPLEYSWGDANDDPWGKVDDDPWGKMADWGADDDSTLSFDANRTISGFRYRRRDKNGWKGKGRKHRHRSDKARQLDPYAFVENIARQQAADAARKQRMHEFYKVCIFIYCGFD